MASPIQLSILSGLVLNSVEKSGRFSVNTTIFIQILVNLYLYVIIASKNIY